MTKIKILPPSLVGKIAAGEVIERPASALKELIENSIDAGAKNIQVYIKNYGIAMIKVVDDGEGILSDEVPLAFQRHATSKIEREEDLLRINTLGFRGEALYSIAQVSKLRIVTQHKEENIGREILLVGGEIKEQKPALTRGTTVEVKELFFNAPVRRKFLRSPSTERAHIIETVQLYALAYPEISFYLNLEGEESLILPKTDSLQSRIAQVFGNSFSDKLDHRVVSEKTHSVEIFIGTREIEIRQRSKQLIFVNRRPIRDSLITNSLYKALEIRESHPKFILFLTVPPEEVDFNIHPTKREVRFKDPSKIVNIITKAATNNPSRYSVTVDLSSWKVHERPTAQYSQQTLLSNRSFEVKPNPVNFLDLGNSVLAIEQPEGILFLDYHGAHERVNFERLLRGDSEGISRLIFPYVIELNAVDYTVVAENLSLINELGIEAETFGRNSIIVRGLPEFLKNSDVAGIFENLAEVLKKEEKLSFLEDIKRKIAATIACHRSLRSNDKINPHEVAILLDQLEKTSDPNHCPHGRPIKKFLSKREITKWFQRKESKQE